MPAKRVTPVSLPNSTLTTLRLLSLARALVGVSSLLSPHHSGIIFGIPLSLSPTQLLSVPAATAAASATITANATLITRLFGVRDLLMGSYLWRSVSGINALQLGKGDSSGFENGAAVTGKAPGGAGAENSALLGSPDTNTKDGVPAQTVSEAVALSQLQSALYIGMLADMVDVVSCAVCLAEGELSGRMMVLGIGGAGVFAVLGALGLREVGKVNGGRVRK